jgi:hypothetical protein
MTEKSSGDNQNFQEWARKLFYTKDDADKIFVTSRELWTATIAIVMVVVGGLLTSGWWISGELTKMKCALGIDCPDLKRIESLVEKTLLPNEKMITSYFQESNLVEKTLTTKEPGGEIIKFMLSGNPLLKIYPLNQKILLFSAIRKVKQISLTELENIKRGTPLVTVYEITSKGTRIAKSVHFLSFR